VGHVMWSMKSLRDNRGGIRAGLKKNFYQTPALVPPMPWIKNNTPSMPAVQASASGSTTQVRWSQVKGCQRYTLQAKYRNRWVMVRVTSGYQARLQGKPEAIAVCAVDRYGNTSSPRVLGLEN